MANMGTFDPVTGRVEGISSESLFEQGFGVSTGSAAELIAKFEGFNPIAGFINANEKKKGIITHGFGNTAKGPKVGDKIDPMGALMDLSITVQDLRKDMPKIVGPVWSTLKPIQQNVIMSLVFNVGRSNFKESKALKALKKRNLEAFSKEAFDSEIGFVKSGDKINDGLVKRRSQEEVLFNAGIN
jgi:GH24 family phage-related lysozyme (muramidase)